MPQYIPNRQINPKNSTVACPSAIHHRKISRFRRQQSAPAEMFEDPTTMNQQELDLVSLKSIGNWSAFGDFAVSTDTLNTYVGRMITCDMFNVFFSIAKENIPNNGIPLSTMGSGTKDQLVCTVYRQHRARQRLLEPYLRLRNAVKKLQEEYSKSKGHNILIRYTQMQKMIHEVILLEKQYWQLIDIPNQEISETPHAYVLRIVSLLEERNGPSSMPQKTGAIAQLLGTTINLAERTKEQTLYQTIRGKSLEDLRTESADLYTDFYTLLHKYHAMRLLVRDLCSSYQDTRFYPIMPRYALLKAMIKRVMRSAAEVEED